MAKTLSRSVDILGVGLTNQGFVSDTPEVKYMTSRELWSWAAQEAIKDAAITAKELDALFVGNMISELSEDQYHLGNLLPQSTGLTVSEEVWKPSVRIEGACASSSHAIRQAAFAIAAGVYDIVIAGGVEINNCRIRSRDPGNPRKMTNEERLQSIYCHYDQAWEVSQLSIQDMVLAQWLIAYAKHYGLDVETMYDWLDARIFSNAYNGHLNPKAYWNGTIEELALNAGFEDPVAFLRSPDHNPVTYWPLRLFDGPRRCDGASAVLLCASEISEQFHKKPIRILGTGNAHGRSFSEKMYSQPFIVEAARQAYEMAGVGPGDIDIVELYDFVAPEYLIPLEDFGYFERGEAWQAVIHQRTRFDSDKPVNTSGGAAASSVVGSVGAVDTYYLVKQLRREAGANQVVPTPEIGLMYDAGAARDCIINIYGRLV